MQTVGVTEELKGDVITKHMLKTGVKMRQGERGGVMFIRPQDTVLDWALKEGFLEPWHEECAMTLLEMRRAWMMPLSITAMMIFRDHAISGGQAADAYQSITRLLGKEYSNIVIGVATFEQSQESCNAMCGEIYRRCFDALEKSLDQWHSEKRLAKESGNV